MLTNSIIKFYLKTRLKQLHNSEQYAIDFQQNILKELVKKSEPTEWGRQFDFKSINNYSDFQNRFPVQDYESLKPFIERMMKGEDRVLWSSSVRWFAKSSGTTSDKSKFIPVSKEALSDCHFKCGMDVMASYVAQYSDTKLFHGKGLVMGGSHDVFNVNHKISFGDISAVMLQNMPALGGYVRTPSLSIALIADWEEKLEKIMRYTLHQNVTHIAGVPTWTVVLIKQILERTGKNYLSEVWKNFELYLHGGVSFTPYEEQFKNFMGNHRVRYLENYNASEGFFGFQNDLSKKELLLTTNHGIFYEFIPVEFANDEHPKTLCLEAIETGKNYAMVITTNAGLWRYKLGDTVRFTSKHPFKFVITGRVKHYINAFGEEVMIENTDKAIALACEKTGASVTDYTVAPVYLSDNQKGCHEWLIEFARQPEDLNAFCVILDYSLQTINSDYEAKRAKDIAVTLPIVHALPPGTFYEWLRAKGKLGGQNKVPRLCNDRSYVDEILAMIQS